MLGIRKLKDSVWRKQKKCLQVGYYSLRIISKWLWLVLKSLAKCLNNRLSKFLASLGEETGILALRLMVNRNLHIMERTFWLLTLVGAIYGALLLTRFQIVRFMKSPTVISVDRNYRDWIGYMPAITLCYYDHIDSYKANEYILENWNVSIVDEDYFYYMDFLYAVVNASASNYADLVKFAEDERFDEVDLYDLIQEIDRPFEQIINTFEGNFEVSVTPVMTERGSCYVINSPMGTVLAGNMRFRFQTFDELKKPLACNFGKQQCFIKIDLLESTGMIDVHSPFEISSTDASVIPLHKSDEIIASYKILETVASSNLRDLNVDQRKCVFNDEETSDLKIYSKSLCLAKCRAMMAVEMCNCVPFFYTFFDGPACNPAGFECLLDFKWPVWALHICKCPSTCIEMEYTVQTVKKSSWGGNNVEEGAKTDVVTSSFRWDLIPPKVRLRRDVVFSYEDLLVSFGGTLALFLGLSILSLIHMIYAIIKHIIEDLNDICLYLWIGCKKLKAKHWNRRKIQQVVPLRKEIIFTEKIKILKKLKQRREKLLKTNWKTSEDKPDVETNDGLNLIQDNSSDSSVFDFVN